ncbi:MAG TPA: penicillin-binding transpeptidase domain-containing protein [Sedimentisphaerales bacterium]|nr:penicillin-binding transpeptidase domain-containing protein [Sedimentisphaerales bacterium]
MYDRRVKIFVIFSLLLLAVCLLRLAQMQLLTASSVQHEIAELKQQRGQSRQLQTIRGRILDRNGNVLAMDEARFWVHINYDLSSFLDERVRKAMLAGAAARRDADVAVPKVDEEIREKLEDLQLIIEKCAQFKAVEPSVIWNEIEKINDYVWGQRMFQAWRKNFPKSEVFEKYDSPVSIPFLVAIADFKTKQPDPNIRDELASKIDILEMHKDWPLLELKTDDDVFAAQLEFMDTEGLQILPKGHRFYPYGSVAAQTIGWVGPATQQQDKKLFADDELLSYLEGEVCGREDGVEYVCETVLRGRRGELSHDIDGQLTSRTPTEFGKDVTLTLDIELQQRIENYLTGYPHDPNCGPGMSAVVIEVGTGDILALVSLPLYDLNRARYDYGELVADSDKPLINRAINAQYQYPPGSVVKPLILIAGLETGQITPEEIISCPSLPAPIKPNCWRYNQYHVGHDSQWENNARNAIKGSCNIYFSHLADRIEPEVIQEWLYKFGYGHDVLFLPDSLIDTAKTDVVRNFNQTSGIISSTNPRSKILSFEDVSPLRESDRRWFGIGQGNLRVTPLQVANAMAALARGGIFKRPRLIWEPGNSEGTDLGISLETLAVVYDGMNAVVNETGGTAHTQFEPFLATLAAEDVTAYGKTGSTERPAHAWFGGFAQDSTARKIAIAVVVEGGQHGSRDAAPLARNIIQLCIEAGYIGTSVVEDTSF